MAWAVNSASLMPVDAIAAAGDVLLLCGFLSAELSKAMGQSLKMRRCKLIPLPADNPDTTVDESKTQCEDISKCFCANVAAWPSKNFCTILRSCKEAQADYEAARKKILAKQSGNPSEECVKALSLSICSYHFPTCLNDVIQYDQICHSTCSALNQTCSITLDEFAQVGSRCNLKKVDSTNAAQVLRANQRCTAAATETAPPVGMLSLPFALSLVLGGLPAR